MNSKRTHQWSWLSLYVKLGILAITFSSCSDAFDLDEEPGKSQYAALPYQDIGQLDQAVTGVYNQLWAGFRWNYAFATAWAGDDITTGPPCCKITITEFDRRQVTDRNSALYSNWSAVYQAIRAANSVLKNVEKTELPGRVQQDALVGEVYFIRAILFHHLARIHGRIPLVLDDVPDFDIGLASQIQVYEQIEADLLQAEALLPVASNLGATRPNSGSARAFLARLYLDWAGFPVKDRNKYQQAAASAKQVIDSAHEHGFSLVNDMGSLYTIAGARNTEGVFTLAHCNPCGLGNRKTGKLGLPSEFGGWHETFAEVRFFEDFPEGHRKDATFHTEVPLDSNGKITANPAEIVTLRHWTEFIGREFPLYRKIIGPFEEGSFEQFQTSKGDYLMRYAEVLLIHAEASARAGLISPDAWESLNKVRRRAEGLAFDQPNPEVDLYEGDLAELAFTERKWELAGEFLRWFDLIRLERVEAALGGTARDPRVSMGTIYFEDGSTARYPIRKPAVKILGPLGTDSYFHPIPPREVLLLPNLGG